MKMMLMEMMMMMMWMVVEQYIKSVLILSLAE